MVISVFQNPAFAWGCAALAGGCLAAAVAVWARAFWTELAAKFVRMPAAGKAALVAFVAVATAVAQKPRREIIELSNNRIIESADVSNLVNPVNPVEENLRASVSPCEVSVTDDDIARGYRLVEIRTNETVSYEMPTNGMVVGTWHLTDAYDAVVRVSLKAEVEARGEGGEWTNEVEARGGGGEWSDNLLLVSQTGQECLSNHSPPQASTSTSFDFPMGSQTVTSLWVHVWGRARPQLKNASNELVAVGAPMFAHHGVSRLWTAATVNGTVLLTWERFFLWNRKEVEARGGGGETSNEVEARGGGGERNVNLLSVAQQAEQECLSNHSPPQASTSTFSYPSISAQLELFPTGDFIARSNEVERVYRRVNPDDWDDDGIPNGEDDDPRVAAGDSQFGPHQDLSVIAHSNNYYWVDLVVPQANALVTFTGDGASNLADPSFVAKAGETNRVVLLLGKPYTADCRLPLVCTGSSHDDIEVGYDEDGRMTICRPVRCEITDDASAAALRASAVMTRAASSSTSGGRRVRFTPEPDGLDVTWNENYCCLEPPPPPFTVPLFSCGGDCGCGGCAVGTYTCRFEGFEMSFPDWPCGCSHESTSDEPTHPDEDEPETEPQGSSVSAAFSASAIIFEDEYENAPGETVARNSTETEVEFNVFGGTKGGTFSLKLRDGGRLERSGGSFLPREGKLEPGESFRIKVKCRARAASGSEGDIKAVATFTEEENEAKITSEATLTAVRVQLVPFFGTLENDCPMRHRLGVREVVNCLTMPSEMEMKITASKGEMEGDRFFRCPLEEATDPLEIAFGGVTYKPSIQVVEPSGVQAFDSTWETFGVPRGSAGGIGLRQCSRILPLDVSFQGISVEEVPSTVGVQTGYFTHPYFDGDRCHSRANGAGVWHQVCADNRVDAADTAAYTQAYPRMTRFGELTDDVTEGWIAGENVWSVPFGWNVSGTSGESTPWKCFAADETQTFTIDEFGTSGVRKLRHEAVREVLGSVYLDGVKVW